jgi:3-methyladenine DNA glycosylase AlkD
VAPLVDFIEPLMRDPEKVVQQGLGWFLREAWKRRPKPVEAFLLRHKETAPRVIVKYATEKMDRAGKERFRRTQSAKERTVRSRRTT